MSDEDGSFEVAMQLSFVFPSTKLIVAKPASLSQDQFALEVQSDFSTTKDPTSANNPSIWE